MRGDDSGPGTYDMGRRRFSPDTARVLQMDMTFRALKDLGLRLDPKTRNQYIPAGGDLISFV